LWVELNQIHFEKSPDFKHRYKNLTFCERKQSLLFHVGKGELFIALAYEGGRKIGYCVSSLIGNAGDERFIAGKI
jgi:hypothetical protein